MILHHASTAAWRKRRRRIPQDKGLSSYYFALIPGFVTDGKDARSPARVRERPAPRQFADAETSIKFPPMTLRALLRSQLVSRLSF